jgi:hypothetical protein
MKLALLVVLAAIFPLLWGWCTHRVVTWLWPATRPPGGDLETATPAERPMDYQI